jgi:hypothetical protein
MDGTSTSAVGKRNNTYDFFLHFPSLAFVIYLFGGDLGEAYRSSRDH